MSQRIIKYEIYFSLIKTLHDLHASHHLKCTFIVITAFNTLNTFV